jgi:hypothetical protein
VITRKPDPAERWTYGTRCSWSGPATQTAQEIGQCVCPHCGNAVYQVGSYSEWFAALERYATEISAPDLIRFSKWTAELARTTCIARSTDLYERYLAETDAEVSTALARMCAGSDFAVAAAFAPTGTGAREAVHYLAEQLGVEVIVDPLDSGEVAELMAITKNELRRRLSQAPHRAPVPVGKVHTTTVWEAATVAAWIEVDRSE